MYNGIGLSTTRGTATSGHVQKNLSYVRPEFFRNKVDNVRTGGQRQDFRGGDLLTNRKVNPEILEHNRKFAMESKVFEYQLKLEEDGLGDEEVQQKCDEYREQLAGKMVATSKATKDSHEISVQAERRNNRVRDAFGLGDDFVPGAAFDPEAQEERRKKREADALAKQEERVKREEARKAEWEKRAKDREERDKARINERDDRDDRDRNRDRNRNRDRSRDTGRDRARRGDSRSPDRRKERRNSRDRERRTRDDSRSRHGNRDRRGDRGGDRSRSRSRDRSQDRKRGRGGDDRRKESEDDEVKNVAEPSQVGIPPVESTIEQVKDEVQVVSHAPEQVVVHATAEINKSAPRKSRFGARLPVMETLIQEPGELVDPKAKEENNLYKTREASNSPPRKRRARSNRSSSSSSNSSSSSSSSSDSSSSSSDSDSDSSSSSSSRSRSPVRRNRSRRSDSRDKRDKRDSRDRRRGGDRDSRDKRREKSRSRSEDSKRRRRA